MSQRSLFEAGADAPPAGGVGGGGPAEHGARPTGGAPPPAGEEFPSPAFAGAGSWTGGARGGGPDGHGARTEHDASPDPPTPRSLPPRKRGGTPPVQGVDSRAAADGLAAVGDGAAPPAPLAEAPRQPAADAEGPSPCPSPGGRGDVVGRAGAGGEEDAAATPRPPGGDVLPFEYWRTPVTAGRTLVEASAGTGKTFAIAGLVLRLVLDPDADPGGPPGGWLAGPDGRPDLRRLLVVTFTNAATEELRTRVRAALRTALAVARGEAAPDPLTRPLGPLLARDDAPDRLLAALDRVDEAGVFTIHGFCRRVLEQSAFESGTPFEMEFVEDTDSDALRARAAADAWARLTHADPLLTAVSLHHGRTPDELKKHHRAVADFPRVRILPEAPGLGDARAALREAQARLAEVWDAEAARAALAGLDWNKDAPLDGAADAPDRVGAWARGEDAGALGLALACAPDALRRHARKTGGGGRSKAERAEALDRACAAPALAACEAVAEAAAALDLAFVRAFVLEVDDRVAAIKERRGQLTFADLITRLHDALHDADTGPALAAGIRRLFGVAVIDEFQDTDPLQYALFRTAFAGRPLTFVGDPKQAIYAFRGADVHAYLGAQREADRRFTLGTNWRSTAGLVEAVNRVFERPERAFLFEGIPFRRVGPSPEKTAPRLEDPGSGPGQALPPLVWWPMPAREDGQPLSKTAANREIPGLVAAEVVRLLREARLDGRPLGAGDVAVLVPTRYEAADVLAALQAANVPAVVSRAHDVRESVVMAEVEYVLRAALRPDDEAALRAALATELWGGSARDLAALDSDPERHAALAGRLRDLQRTWRRTGVLGALVAFAEAEGVLARLLAHADGERRATDLRHTAELLHEVEASGGRSPEDLLHWLRHRADQALPSREMKELRLERDAAAVTVTTHHNAKGLEYEVVFLPYLWSVGERDYTRQTPALARTENGVVYDLGSDALGEHDRLRQADALAEGVRRAYVALTRARERCYVVWGPVTARGKRLDPNSSLGYLLAGHAAAWDGGLADHVEAARRAAAVDDPFAAVAALDPEGAVLRVAEPPPTPAPLPNAEADGPAGAARALDGEARQRVGDAWRRASFSAWRGAHAAGAGLAASDEADEEPPGDAVPAGLHAFAAGPGPGTCLHKVLQHADWRTAEDVREEVERHNREAVERWLRAHGLAERGRPHRAPLDPVDEVCALVRRVAGAPLFTSPGQEGLVQDQGVSSAPGGRTGPDGGGGRDGGISPPPPPFSPPSLLPNSASPPPRLFSSSPAGGSAPPAGGAVLADADALRTEWTFAFPLGRTAPAALADAFREHGAAPFGPAYADAVAALSRDAVDGLMTGEIDLVAHAGGRWWIVDWKSNRLGADASAYGPAALAATMAGHHYGLQLHLYTLGLHRHLRSRLGDGYDYDGAVGGAVYVFLRGMEGGGESGLFRHRPSADLIDALDRALAADA